MRWDSPSPCLLRSVKAQLPFYNDPTFLEVYLGLSLSLVTMLFLQTLYLILRCANLAIKYLYTNPKTKWRLRNQQTNKPTNQLCTIVILSSFSTMNGWDREFNFWSHTIDRFRLRAGPRRPEEAEELRSECGHGGSQASRSRGIKICQKSKKLHNFSRRGSRHSLSTYNSTTAMLPDSPHFR